MSQQSFHQQEADGSNITFTITTFTEDEIKVYVDGVESTNGGSNQNDYTIPNYTTSGGTVTWNTSGSLTAPTSPSIVRVVRQTDVMNNGNTDVEGKATFTAGSSIKADDLNKNQKQVLRSLQEHNEHKIQKYDIEDKAVTREKIALDAVDGTRLADDAVDSEHLAADSIDTEHYAPGSVDATAIGTNAVTSAKILNDNVTMEKLGSGALPTDITVNSDNIVNGSIQTADIGNNQITSALIANDQIDSQHYADLSIDTQHIGNKQVTGGKIADGTITDTQIATGTLDSRYFTETELTSTGVLDSRYYTETELSPSGSVGSNVLDARYFTESEVESNFLRQDSSETIASGVTWSSVDDKVATTKAIDLRIIDLVDDVGGFVPIADELSFPNDNPDINDPDSGSTIVSIKAINTSRTPTAGTVTIANGTLGNSTVTITGCGSTVLPAGFGVLVETTSVGNTYQFHRLVPKATEVSTVAANAVNIAAAGANVQDIHNFADLYQISTSAPTARADSSSLVVGDLWFDSSSNKVLMIYDGSSGDGFTAATPNASDLANIAIVAGQITFTEDLGNITDSLATATGNTTLNTVAGIATEATTVAGIASNVTAVANNATNINAVAADAADIGAVAGKATQIGLLGTTDAIADMNTLGTSAIVTDMDTLADISTNITTVANNDSNVTTVAGIASNVTTVAGNNAAVSTVANNDANITTVAGSITNVNTTAGSISNVNTVAGSISNVNTAASNVTNINNFANRYRIASSAPSTNNDEGDLYFDTTSDELRVYNGTAWQGGVTATGNLAGTGANTFTGDQTVNANIIVSGTVDGKDISALGITGTTLANGVTATTQSASDNSTKVATTAYTDTAIANLVDSSPSALNTLNELAAAIGDDANFSTTITNSIATKLPLAGGTITGDLILDGATAGRDITFDRSASELEFADNSVLVFGDGTDLQMYHDGTDSYFDNNTGVLRIYSDNIYLKDKDGGDMFIKCIHDGAVELYHDNDKKLETTDLGTKIIGDLFLDNPDHAGKDIQFDSSLKKMKFDDDVSANFGSNDDLAIFHDGSNSVIRENGTGDLYLQSGTSNILRVQSSGVTVTGTCTATTFSGSGSSLTSLNASNISSGTIAAARVPTLNQNTTGNAASADTLDVANSSSNSTFYPTFVDNNGSAKSFFIDNGSGLTFNPSTNTLVAGTFSGTHSGNGSALTSINAATLDSIDSSQFLRSDQNDSTSGALTAAYLYATSAINASSGASFQANGFIRTGAIGIHPGGTTTPSTTGEKWLHNDSSGVLRWGSSANNSDGTIWHSGNDGSGSGLDADKLDGKQDTDFLRSNAGGGAGSYTASSAISFDGGAGAVTIKANCDIRLTTGGWTGDHSAKIQHHSNILYIQGGTSGHQLRTSSGGHGFTVDSSGNCTALGNLTAYSDARLKTNVNTIDNALDIVDQLRGVSFDWIESGKHSIGLIAQEVEEVIPELVLTSNDLNPDTGEEKEVKSVDYGKIVGVLINAVKELKAEVEELKGGK